MVIGLTGGIASGKSTVTQYLQTRYRISVYDADSYAHRALEPGTPVWQALVQRYGAAVLLADGRINRSWLGEQVFGNPAERRWLEALVHPWVRQCYTQISPADGPVVFSIPLLFEAQMTDLVHQVWVVWCTTQQQYQRLVSRNRLTPAQAHARISAQLPLPLKMLWADQLLDNSGTLDHLYQQVDRCIQPLLPPRE
ncbi:MAG: dephospho-CoA kinase [Gloeomargarita sp. SKYBB_i_bin120]|nr:dephospho-CoA kinase [Gloeomargarita sp. SKYG98]MCS7292794.1 dephospho-CoA kinase [Gloeomargarita sp. SKYB120]MDW8178357.1 dephospho-CoA kinase [Gloeomargarita sp. SKYBB_i_bin120]